MLALFIDKILVYEANGRKGLYRRQKIEIHFKHIGNALQKDEISEEEFLQQVEDQQREKQRKRSERARQRKDALKLAAESGDAEAIMLLEARRARARFLKKKRRDIKRESQNA